jgi:hypothetical protein
MFRAFLLKNEAKVCRLHLKTLTGAISPSAFISGRNIGSLSFLHGPSILQNFTGSAKR